MTKYYRFYDRNYGEIYFKEFINFQKLLIDKIIELNIQETSIEYLMLHNFRDYRIKYSLDKTHLVNLDFKEKIHLFNIRTATEKINNMIFGVGFIFRIKTEIGLYNKVVNTSLTISVDSTFLNTYTETIPFNINNEEEDFKKLVLTHFEKLMKKILYKCLLSDTIILVDFSNYISFVINDMDNFIKNKKIREVTEKEYKLSCVRQEFD